MDLGWISQTVKTTLISSYSSKLRTSLTCNFLISLSSSPKLGQVRTLCETDPVALKAQNEFKAIVHFRNSEKKKFTDLHITYRVYRR